MTTSTNLHALAYRSDIDGLRALAVIAVVLFHLGVPVFQGGYVGVDIFFVISGYLITKLLVTEKTSTGTINLWMFYLRRARRLLPALLFTLVVTSCLAIGLFTSQRLQSYGGSLLHAVLSVSNIFFYSESGYFDSASDLKPLLHTWSLAVEEQFYFLWPVLICLVGGRKVLLGSSLAILALLSFVCGELFLTQAPSAVFYLMPFRIFEFAIGACLILLPANTTARKAVVNMLFISGALMLLLPIAFFDKSIAFPGIAAVVPCVGTALCIYTGDLSPYAKFLRSKVVSGIGLISYSLYLVHWPLIVFYKYIFHSHITTAAESLSLLALCLLLSTLSYRFVETPFRKREIKVSVFLLGCLMSAVSLSYVGASMWATGGWSWRPWIANKIALKEIESGKDRRFEIRRTICEKKGWSACDVPTQAKTTRALILGDSHAPDALNAFYHAFPFHDFSLSTLGGCPPHPDITAITVPNHPDRAQCAELNRTRYDVAYLKQFDYIVINVLFGWYTPEHLRDYLQFLRANKIEKVLVFGGYFSLSEELPELINTYGYVTEDFQRFLDFKADNDAAIRTYTQEIGFFFISKRDVFCPRDICEFFDPQGIPFTYDRHHLSAEFSKRLLDREAEKVRAFIESQKPATHQEPRDIPTEIVQIIDWGPRSTTPGLVPNRQPHGELGLWIKIQPLQNILDLKLFFDNNPAKITTVEKDLITAAIEPALINTTGKKTVSLRTQNGPGYQFVGNFEVAE